MSFKLFVLRGIKRAGELAITDKNDFAYKLIMEKYNDFLINDTNIMESIAREYQRVLNNNSKNLKEKDNKKPLEKIETYEKLKTAISETYFVVNNIKRFCNTKVYYGKKNYISKILNQLQELPNKKIDTTPNVDNYCMAVDYCIKKLSNVIQLALQILEEVEDIEYKNILNVILQVSNILPTVSCLFGVCKYRW